MRTDAVLDRAVRAAVAYEKLGGFERPILGVPASPTIVERFATRAVLEELLAVLFYDLDFRPNDGSDSIEGLRSFVLDLAADEATRFVDSEDFGKPLVAPDKFGTVR